MFCEILGNHSYLKDAIINLKKYFETLQAKIAELQNQSKLAQDQGDEGDAGVSVGNIAILNEKKTLISRSSSQQRLEVVCREMRIIYSFFSL